MSNIYDLAIIGGGPAGAAAGVYASRKRLKTVFITKDWLSQSSVSDKIENWIGTVAISGADFAANLEKHVKTYGKDIVDFIEGQTVSSLSKNGLHFQISTEKNKFLAKAVLISSGSRRRKLEIPGADKYENKGVTYCATCDGPLYSNQDVIVVGGGNAGFDAAAQLMAYCKSVTLLSRSNFKADPETVETVLKNPKIKAVEHAKLLEIKGDKFVTALVYSDKEGRTHEVPTAGIFAEVGSIPNTAFAKDIVKLDPNNHVIVDAKTQRTATEGIWAAGDCTDGLFHQNNIAAGDAVKAIEDIYLWVKTR